MRYRHIGFNLWLDANKTNQSQRVRPYEFGIDSFRLIDGSVFEVHEMKIQLQFTKSGRQFSLWQLLLVIAIVAIVLALLPRRIGGSILFAIEATLIVALFVILSVLGIKRLIGK